MPESSVQRAERRNYFRLDDQVALRYRLLDADQLDQVLAQFEDGQADAASLVSNFAASTAYMRRNLERFRSKSPELAVYLEGLNDKLDHLIQLLALSQEDVDDRPTHDVNLSGSGIGLSVAKALPLDANVEVKLMMFPDYISILAVGKVVRCELDHELPAVTHQVAIEFTHIREADRDLIVRHVTQRQSSKLREDRQAKDDA